jgi:hypothetical protein
MTLGERQELFSRLIAKLITKMYDMGYQVRCGDFYALPRNPLEHTANSRHYEKCAGDLNLFKDGKYLTTVKDHADFGAYWEGLDPRCRWGGRWPSGDANHYEVVP